MTLINTLLYHATETHWEQLSSELERLNARKAVIVRALSVTSAL